MSPNGYEVPDNDIRGVFLALAELRCVIVLLDESDKCAYLERHY